MKMYIGVISGCVILVFYLVSMLSDNNRVLLTTRKALKEDATWVLKSDSLETVIKKLKKLPETTEVLQKMIRVQSQINEIQKLRSRKFDSLQTNPSSHFKKWNLSQYL